MRVHAAIFFAPAFLALCSSAAQLSAQVDGSLRTPFDAPRRTMLSNGSADIPLMKVGQFYYVDVKLNGRPFRFTIETGAGLFMISGRAARVLGVKVDSVELIPGSRAAVVRIDSLTMPGVSFQGLTARVNPMWDSGDFDGVISVPVLHDVLATLDLAASRLRLSQDTLPVPNGRDVTAILGRDPGGRIDVVMDFGGLTLPVVLDTRSFISIVVPDSVEAALRFSDAPRSIGGARGPSLGAFTLRGAHLASDLRIGALSVRTPALALRNRPGAIVGVAFLEQFSITIDQRHQRIRFTRPGNAVAIIPPQDWETGGSVGASGAAPSPRIAGPAPTGRPMGFNLAGSPGGDLTVVNLVSGSNADKAGIHENDRVVEFDGTPATSMNPDVFRKAVAKTMPVKVVVIRDDKRLEFMITPQHPL
jgi:Aspartyl protease/PDZ domain